MPESLPPKRITFGYATVFATVAASIGLWLVEMTRADALHTNPWIYPAKLGSHGTLMLMCWAFILATRFRPVERLFGGLDKVYKAHRHIGEVAFFLIFLHPIFLAIARTDSPGEFLRYFWFSGDWGRNLGIIAIVAFAVLVVLSVYWKIAYHRWKRTHDLFGLLLMLVIAHAIVAGGEMTKYPVLTVWYGAWATVGIAAYVYIRLLYRVVGPQYDVVVSRVEQLADQITEVYLKPVGRPMQFRAGQFLYVSFDSDAVSEEPHPFSISSPPEQQEIRLSIKRLGDWTGDVQHIRPGERARIWGPYGKFGLELERHRDLPAVMIGGGIGITPFLSIIASESFTRRHGPDLLIYSVPRAEKQVYRDEINRQAGAIEHLRAVMHLSDEEGFIDTDYLKRHLDRPLRDYVWLLCGPLAMIESMRKLLEKQGVRDKQILYESFAIR